MAPSCSCLEAEDVAHNVPMSTLQGPCKALKDLIGHLRALWQFVICSIAENNVSGDYPGQRAFENAFMKVFHRFCKILREWRGVGGGGMDLALSWSHHDLATHEKLPYCGGSSNASTNSYPFPLSANKIIKKHLRRFQPLPAAALTLLPTPWKSCSNRCCTASQASVYEK